MIRDQGTVLKIDPWTKRELTNCVWIIRSLNQSLVSTQLLKYFITHVSKEYAMLLEHA